MVITLLTEERVREIVFAAVRDALAVQPPQPQRDGYLDTAGAAEYLGTTKAALHMMVQRGTLKPDSRGGRGRFKGHRFARATLDAYIAGKS